MLFAQAGFKQNPHRMFCCGALPTMETIINLCKRRGFVFQSSEIYGGITGFYDLGPLGTEMKNNIKKVWWRDMVQRRDDMVGVDCSIISSPLVWKASGHIAGFSEPMVDCKVTKNRYRADQVFWAPLLSNDDAIVCYVSVLESDNMLEEATTLALKKAKAMGFNNSASFKPLVLRDLTTATAEVFSNIPSPATGQSGQLTFPRDFNLMFQTQVGVLSDESATAYLRPETAQVMIYLKRIGV